MNPSLSVLYIISSIKWYTWNVLSIQLQVAMMSSLALAAALHTVPAGEVLSTFQDGM